MFSLLDDSLGFVINKTALVLKSELEKNLRHLDITAVQFMVLKRLWEEDGLNQKEIAQRTYKKTAEITHVLDKLVKKGLLSRESSEHDRREYRIHLTPEGKNLEKEALHAAYKTLEDALQGISKNECDQLLLLLEKIFTNLYRE